MVIQRRNIPPGLLGKWPGPDKIAQGNQAPLWNKLPQFLNQLRYRMNPAQQDDLLDYEPIHLHITPSEVHPIIAAMEKTALAGQTAQNANAPQSQELEPENFRFLLDQVPAVRTIVFTGNRVDPFRNRNLLDMVDYAFKFNGAESTVVTDGFLLSDHAGRILTSNLHTLVVRIQAHRPSAYAQMTGLPPGNFPLILNNLRHLIQQKRALHGTVEIDLSMTVDLHNFRDIPVMIAFAEELGADGVRFENYLPPNPAESSDRTLYTHQKPVIRFLEKLSASRPAQGKLAVVLPTLLDADMSGYRNCLDPYTTVSVDAAFNVTGCSRQALYRGKTSKIWDENFWNSDLYQWLRQVHGQFPTGAPKLEVPAPCRNCPRNMPSKLD